MFNFAETCGKNHLARAEDDRIPASTLDRAYGAH